MTTTTTTTSPTARPTGPSAAPVDPARLEAAMGHVFSELAVNTTAPLIVLGERLGLWRALSGAGPLSAQEVVSRTGLVERYVREWLRGVAVAGYLEYQPDAGTFQLAPEYAAVLADDEAPTALVGIFSGLPAFWHDLDQVAGFFRSGTGMPWGEHHPALSEAQARFTRPMYLTELVDGWFAGVDGLTNRLRQGIRVLDIGCGDGVSTHIGARAFPASSFTGIDIDPAAIRRARTVGEPRPASRGPAFEVGSATSFGEAGAYDLVLFSDCLHDLGDPVAAVANTVRLLAPGGVVLVVEPLAADRFEDDFTNPYARIGYAVSTMVCLPASLVAADGAGLGAMAGESRLRDVLRAGGLSTVRRVPLPPEALNIVLEARP